MNVQKTVYAIKFNGDYYEIIFEDYDEAKACLKECKKNFPGNEYILERFIFKPRRCPKCGHFELLTIPEREPWAPVHYQCPGCDSTYDMRPN